MNMNPKLEYACIKELLSIFKLHKATFYRWLRRGKIPKGRKVGNKVMYSVRDFVAAVRKNGLRVDPVALELFEPASDAGGTMT